MERGREKKNPGCSSGSLNKLPRLGGNVMWTFQTSSVLGGSISFPARALQLGSLAKSHKASLVSLCFVRSGEKLKVNTN